MILVSRPKQHRHTNTRLKSWVQFILKQESLDILTQYLRVLHALHDVQKAAEIQACIDRLTGTPTQQ